MYIRTKVHFHVLGYTQEKQLYTSSPWANIHRNWDTFLVSSPVVDKKKDLGVATSIEYIVECQRGGVSNNLTHVYGLISYQNEIGMNTEPSLTKAGWAWHATITSPIIVIQGCVMSLSKGFKNASVPAMSIIPCTSWSQGVQILFFGIY